ncbi:2-oxoglutarate dehydrogenase E1 component [Marinobacter persicus]|uniref:2-oxoglutarate dehydrogenase E1 component n=1 Tax=Marinobacter persicus TaxID=930118 RepID=A0A2S6G7G3_9GAMM|nr:2-oxoglutarate dehydrogenase E1 component [Marinobacter persicus]PPK52192.1 2-oxoglutarate dehydrogenase E1 component [Marinobacter persicus]PPK55119.1 2-oxoglutarate dehydrogenase E1 component [Marinobacter persicus]PPK58952.1 2-oxoglutarate dehydrogenase E1 component [Marinobacter persicus]
MHESIMEQLWQTSHLQGGNLTYVEQLFETYLTDPNAIPEEWRSYFDQLPSVEGGAGRDVDHSVIREQFEHIARNQRFLSGGVPANATSSADKKQIRVLQLINAFRFRGHQESKLDPLGVWQRKPVEDLDPRFHELGDSDMDLEFQTGSLNFGSESMKLGDIVKGLRKTYCESIGAEYMHVVDTRIKRWFQQRMEPVRSRPEYEVETRKHILERLVAAEGLEKYLGSRYPGVKRFGLEGGESLIPCLDELIQRAGSYGAKEIVLGMAHRGRLNVLVNTLGKNPRELFDEFEGKKLADFGSGDVKYHQGFSSNVMTPGGEVHLAMAFNPSHLEIVSPVVEGSVRARQDRRGDTVGDQVVPIVMHGDAAFAGQGVVMETFQGSETRGFGIGGTIHIVINNQVGFTTHKKEDARSTEYCTDVAKMVQAPILHVNADDPEAVMFVTRMAMDYRKEFHRDIVIDLVCYRRRGHNEADEPAATQPLMYDKIRKLKSTRVQYADRLVAEGVITEEESKQMENEYRDALDNGEHVAKSLVKEPNTDLYVDWTPYLGHEWTAKCETSVPLKTIQELGKKITQLPEGFSIQRQVSKIIKDREKMTAGALALNWGYGEMMAYATLLNEGHPVRITGQDVGRGTFSHRHAVLHNQKDGSTHITLKELAEDQPRFDIYDSYLSEEAVMAFEYGYASTSPNSLVVWEAQFGDFANGAQVVIDQFLTSGEHKWGRLCGLTLLLPHGYEGQGPEHSSARLERYLQLCAQHNIQVCVPSTPSQVFHMLRRQAKRPLRKPLIAITPKSLLRHKEAVSDLDDLTTGTFKTVLPEKEPSDPSKVTRLILCAGKVYFDLLEKKKADERDDVAIVRIEQLYPFPEDDLDELMSQYTNLENVVWCQEEPMNQGAWYCSQHHMHHSLHRHDPKLKLQYAGRAPSAAPACGHMSVHIEEQKQLINDAFEI